MVRAAYTKASCLDSWVSMAATKSIQGSWHRLRVAIGQGDLYGASQARLDLLAAAHTWPSSKQTQALIEALATIGVVLQRNEWLKSADAPYLIGEHVEIERVEFGLRFVWVPGTVVDARPPVIRARLLRNPRALDYLVRESDGEERWRADDGMRKAARELR